MSPLSKSSLEMIKYGASVNRQENLRIEFRDGVGELLAGVSVWYSNTPTYNGLPVAFLGNYKTRSRASGIEILHLAEAEIEKLAINKKLDRKIEYLVGPVNGNTFKEYRLVTSGFDSPPFALENFTARDLPGHFIAAGYQSIATYSSSILPPSTKIPGDDKELATSGITIRNFRMEEADRELSRLYKITSEAFENNFLYSPISQEEFKEMYKPVLPLIDPQFLFIAEKDGRAVGYLFAIDDRKGGGKRDNCLVIKTLARCPEESLNRAGIGRNLVRICHDKARKRGYGSIIHALYKSDNRSGCFSTLSGAQVFRQYALYAKRLHKEGGEGLC